LILIEEIFAQWGFSAAAFFLMWKMSDDTIKKNTEALGKLSERIAQCPLKKL